MRSPIGIVALAALNAVSFVNADGIYSKGSAVLQIDGKSYDKLIKNSNRASIVEFYAPWCGHCQNLKPAYEKAAKSLEGLANVAAVNCDDESNKAFCGSMNIKGFPTLKTVRPTLHKGKSIVTDYNGARTAAGIVEAVKEIIPNHVKRTTDKDLGKWLEENNSTTKAILFSDKGTTSALIKILASDFYGNIHFAQIRDKDTTAISTFGVTSYPSLVVLPGGTAPAVAYSGDMSKEPMSIFLAKYAAKGTGFISPDAKSKQKPIGKDKAAASSDSSTFSEASAAYKSAEASDAAASGTTITLAEPEGATASPNPVATAEDAPGPASMPDIAPPLPTLSGQTELQAQCLGSKTPTCILALLPTTPSTEESTLLPDSVTSALSSLSGISEKHKVRGSHLFPFFAVPSSNEGNALLRGELGLAEGVQLIAVNGRRSWWRHFNDQKGFGRNEVEGWVDGIRLSEGKKEKLPSGLVIDTDTEDMTESVASATSKVDETAESATSVAASSAASMTDAAKGTVSSATNAAGSAMSSATASAKSASSNAGDSAESVTKSAKSITDSAGSSVGSATSVVAESVASAASAASEKARSVTSIVGESAASGASQASSAASSVTSAVAESAEGAFDAAKDTASSATSLAADQAATAGSSISSVSDNAASAASSATSNVGSAASSVSASAASAAGESDHLGEKVGKKVDSLTEKVGEKVGGATEVVKEKVGKATGAAKAKKEGVVHGEL